MPIFDLPDELLLDCCGGWPTLNSDINRSDALSKHPLFSMSSTSMDLTQEVHLVPRNESDSDALTSFLF